MSGVKKRKMRGVRIVGKRNGSRTVGDLGEKGGEEIGGGDNGYEGENEGLMDGVGRGEG